MEEPRLAPRCLGPPVVPAPPGLSQHPAIHKIGWLSTANIGIYNMIQQENMETSPPKVVFSKINPVVWSNDLTKMWSSESWIWTSLDLFALQQQHRGPSALLHGQGTYPARKPRSSAVYFELRSKLGVGILTTGAGGLLGRSFLRAMPNPVLTHSYSRTSPDFAVASTSHLWQRTRQVRPG